MILISQEVIFFFDDSGVLHKNEESGCFIYAGFVFTDRNTLKAAKRRYIHANKVLKKKLHRNDELKAASLSHNQRRCLFNSVKAYDSVSIAVDISRVYDYILANKKSICRYKDYILKRCVKEKLVQLISSGIISKNKDITILINIDEQLTATNGYYDLRDSIVEELQHGIRNYDYGITHSHLFDSNVTVNIKYCNSSSNYLIQASDILANRIWTSYRDNQPQLREINNNLSLTFP